MNINMGDTYLALLSCLNRVTTFFTFFNLFKKYNSLVNNTYSKTNTKSTHIQINSLWITKCCLGQPCSKIYWQVFLLRKLNWQIPSFPPLLIWGETEKATYVRCGPRVLCMSLNIRYNLCNNLAVFIIYNCDSFRQKR